MKHVFVSYLRENKDAVDKLCEELRRHGIEVWLDREKILPGDRWQQSIRKAIEEGSFFIACFSQEYAARDRTFLNEELTIAVEVLRKTSMERRWFIPVKLSDCSIPERPIGGGETLKDLQWVDLFSDWDSEVRRILAAIQPETVGLSRTPPALTNAAPQSETKAPAHEQSKLSGTELADLRSQLATSDVAKEVKDRSCPNCKGTGWEIRGSPSIPSVCRRCGGTGIPRY